MHVMQCMLDDRADDIDTIRPYHDQLTSSRTRASVMRMLPSIISVSMLVCQVAGTRLIPFAMQMLDCCCSSTSLLRNRPTPLANKVQIRTHGWGLADQRHPSPRMVSTTGHRRNDPETPHFLRPTTSLDALRELHFCRPLSARNFCLSVVWRGNSDFHQLYRYWPRCYRMMESAFGHVTDTPTN